MQLIGQDKTFGTIVLCVLIVNKWFHNTELHITALVLCYNNSYYFRLLYYPRILL